MGTTLSQLILSYAEIKVFMFEVCFWFLLTLLIQYSLSESRSHVLQKYHQKITVDMPQLQVKAISQGIFLKGQVTQKGIILKKTVELPTFTMKVLCTLQHNSRKIKMNFSLKILNILKLFSSLSIREWHSCLLFHFTHTIYQFTVQCTFQYSFSSLFSSLFSSVQVVATYKCNWKVLARGKYFYSDYALKDLTYT